MNKLFGFFKDKINEAKEENKQQLNTIAQAFNDSQYSKEKVLNLLQSAKMNYITANIIIANEASTGLYYSQTHNRGICLRKIKENRELRKQVDENRMKLQYVKKTKNQLKQISELSVDWASSMNNEIEGIYSFIKRSKQNKQAKIEASAKVEEGQDSSQPHQQAENREQAQEDEIIEGPTNDGDKVQIDCDE